LVLVTLERRSVGCRAFQKKDIGMKLLKGVAAYGGVFGVSALIELFKPDDHAFCSIWQRAYRAVGSVRELTP
jgi:hypothetical protein